MTITYMERTLPSGLRVAAEIDPKAQTAAAGYFVRTGARDEPASLMGVSHLLEHMLFKGSATRTAKEVNEGFDAIGASNNAFTSSELTAYHAHVLPEHFSSAVSLLSDLIRPALRAEDLDDERKVVLEEIAMYADRPPSRLSDEVMERWYTGHSLGHRVLGTNETVSAMQRDQLEQYFRSRYSPDNSVLVAAGNLDFERLVDQAAHETSSWVPTNPTRSYLPIVTGTGRLEKEDKQAHRSYRILLSDAPSAQDDRRYAATILANIIGDSEGSRYYWALVEPGIAEASDMEFVGRDGTGFFGSYIACEPENAERAEEILRNELRKAAGTITLAELSRAVAMVTTSITIGSEQPAGRMFRLGSQLSTLGRWISLEDELKRLESLTTGDMEQLMHEFPLEPTLVGGVGPTRE